MAAPFSIRFSSRARGGLLQSFCNETLQQFSLKHNVFKNQTLLFKNNKTSLSPSPHIKIGVEYIFDREAKELLSTRVLVMDVGVVALASS